MILYLVTQLTKFEGKQALNFEAKRNKQCVDSELGSEADGTVCY